MSRRTRPDDNGGEMDSGERRVWQLVLGLCKAVVGSLTYVNEPRPVELRTKVELTAWKES